MTVLGFLSLVVGLIGGALTDLFDWLAKPASKSLIAASEYWPTAGKCLPSCFSSSPLAMRRAGLRPSYCCTNAAAQY